MDFSGSVYVDGVSVEWEKDVDDRRRPEVLWDVADKRRFGLSIEKGAFDPGMD